MPFDLDGRVAGFFAGEAVQGLIVGALLTGFVVLARNRRLRRGPVSLGEFRDTTGDEGAALQVASIIRDRLARAGTEPRGIVPSYSGADLSPQQLTSATLSSGSSLASLVFGLFQLVNSSPGFRVGATLRRSARTGEVGLTIVVEQVSNGRHHLVRTVWGNDAADAARQAAYEVAAWHQGLRTHASSRRRPRWRPTADALKSYEDAVFYASRRRFDVALESARRGIGTDPSNLALRRVLGETYERIGHHFNALHTYAAGIVLLRDRTNGWSRGEAPPRTGNANSRWPYPWWGWRPLSSPEAASLFWRYTVVLTFADQWVDRWIEDLERSRAQRAARVAADTGRVRPAERWEVLPGKSQLTERDELVGELEAGPAAQGRVERFEQARQMRGFLARRYQRLLEAEFPLLNQAWFAESQERGRAFVIDPESVVPQPSPDEMLEREHRRFPLREPFRRRPSARRLPVYNWLLPLEELYRCLDEIERGLSELPDHEISIGSEPENLPELLREVHDRLGTGLRRGILGTIAAALRDRDRWADLTSAGALLIDRQLVASVAGWAAHQLLRLNPVHPAFGPRRDRLATLTVQLDLRTFLHRASLYEVNRQQHEKDVKTSAITPEPLRRMLRLKARYNYLQRLHELRGSAVPDSGRPGDPLSRFGLRVATADAARPIATQWAAARMSWGRAGAWNLWYYAACVTGMVIQEPPGPEADDQTVSEWKRRNDRFADAAIRALNEAILVRRRGDMTAIEAGATDWLLYEDPDLDHLRAHPGFERWASATFGVGHVDQRTSRVDAWQRARRGMLDGSEWRNRGVFGLTRHWGPALRLFWLANDLYLVNILTQQAPMIAERWFAQAQRFAQAGGTAGDLRELTERLERDEQAWRALALYRLFPAQPHLRRALTRALDALIDAQPHRDLQFPTSQEVLSGRAAVDYSKLDRDLGGWIRDARRDLAEIRRPAGMFHHPDAGRLAQQAWERWHALAAWASKVEVPEGETGETPALVPRTGVSVLTSLLRRGV